jgi:hypothetical protein
MRSVSFFLTARFRDLEVVIMLALVHEYLEAVTLILILLSAAVDSPRFVRGGRALGAQGTPIHRPFEISTSLLSISWLLRLMAMICSAHLKSWAFFNSSFRFLSTFEMTLVS